MCWCEFITSTWTLLLVVRAPPSSVLSSLGVDPLNRAALLWAWLKESLSPFPISVLQHWQDIESHLSCIGHSRYWGRGHRFLPWPGNVWALSPCCGAAVGWGGWAQWHRALCTVPRTTKTIHISRASQLLKMAASLTSLLWSEDPCLHTLWLD